MISRKHRILPRVPKPRQALDSAYTDPQVSSFLTAFGDSHTPLPSTVRTLDELITDYIIETCHEAAAVAHHSRRQKIKLDDFKFMLRRDVGKLGRVSEMLDLDKELKRKRRAFDTDEGAVVRGGGPGGEEGEDGVKGQGMDASGKGPGKAGAGANGEQGERKKRRKNKNKGRDDASTIRSG